MIRAILAMDLEGGIGKNGTLPWPKNKADLKWFRESTLNSIVMMGRKTWEDTQMKKPLPHRYNVVVSDRGLDTSDTRPNIVITRDKVEQYATSFENKDVWIIGGAQLFEASWGFIKEVWISKIDNIYNCDARVNIPKHFELFEMFDNFDTGLNYEKLRNPM